jgi:RsiW-degrading membrane proteinase PrsW (M82 family)
MMSCMLGVILSVYAALLPAAVYAWFVNWLDRHEKEPWWMLALAFAWGAMPAFLVALAAQLILDIPTSWILAPDSLAYEIAGGSIWAPVTEEIAKGLGVLLVLLVARPEVDSIMDGIVFGAMAGLGFAFTENVLYFGTALADNGWGGWTFVVLLRTIPFGLNHALFTGLTGAGLGAAYLAVAPVKKAAAPLLGLGGGMLFHAVHNLGASLASTSWLTLCFSLVFDGSGLLLLGALILMVWRQEQRWMSEHLLDEVNGDVFALVTSRQRWARARRDALLRADRTEWRRLSHIRQAATELAFKKHQLARHGARPGTLDAVAHFRQRLIDLEVARPISTDGEPANGSTI